MKHLNYDEKYQVNFPNSHYLANINNLNATNQSIHLNRLPTLGEILANKTKSPVDLYTFYQFMKDVEGKVDYLDFWFDLINHLNLCKHYVKGLRDSIVRTSTVLHHSKDVDAGEGLQQLGVHPQDIIADYRMSQPISDRSKHKSLSSSILLDLIINDNILEENDSHRLSAFLRGDINLDNVDPKLNDLIEHYNAELQSTEIISGDRRFSPTIVSISKMGNVTRSSPTFINTNRLPSGESQEKPTEKRINSQSKLIDETNDSIDEGDYSYSYENQLEQGEKATAARFISLLGGQGGPAATAAATNANPFADPQSKRKSINPVMIEKLLRDVTPKSQSDSFITRDRLRESSHNLMLKYFVEDSEKNLYLPSNINSAIIKNIEVDGRDDPDIFHNVKNYIFNKIQLDHLPKFLDYMATRNINNSRNWRTILGFFGLFIGFWVSFILVFLDYRKSMRPVILLPFFVGFYLLFSATYLIDPIMAWFGYSESFATTAKGSKIIKVREKFIYLFILKRSHWVLFLIILATAVMTILFSLVPGHRL